MSRTEWTLAVVTLAGLLAVAVAIGIAETPEGGIAAGGLATAGWAVGIAAMRANA